MIRIEPIARPDSPNRIVQRGGYSIRGLGRRHPFEATLLKENRK